MILVIAAICGIFLRNRPADLGLQQVGSETVNLPPAAPARGKAGNLQWGLIYRVKEVWYIGIVYFMYGFSYVIYMTYFKAFLLDAGVADARASAMWALVGGLSIFCGVIWGSISDILGRGNGAALAYLTLACSYIILPFSILWALLSFSRAFRRVPEHTDNYGCCSRRPRGSDLAPAGVLCNTLSGLGSVRPDFGGYFRDATGAFALSLSWLQLFQ